MMFHAPSISSQMVWLGIAKTTTQCSLWAMSTSSKEIPFDLMLIDYTLPVYTCIYMYIYIYTYTHDCNSTAQGGGGSFKIGNL